MPIRTPQVPLLREPSTAVVQVCCGTVIWLRPSRLILVYLVTLRLPSIKTPRLYISKPLSAARGQNLTRTAIIFVCVDAFIQALTAKHEMLTLLPVTRSRTYDTPITGLVTVSTAIILAGSSSWSSYLNLGGLRWLLHLVPIVQTSH